MTTSQKKHRIIFIDLIRAFAVLQMVQGHTIDVVLSPEYRVSEYPLYTVWYFMRGITAPVFLFTAGTVFTYLFRLVDKPFFQNPRFIKGVKRSFLLLFIGYLLRYPTSRVFDFTHVSETSWRIFFSVDVLHLIGVGLLLLLILMLISEKLVHNDFIVFGIAVLVIFLISPIMNSINWIEFLPPPIAAYFYKKTGSLFPLFPWVGYIISGALLGTYLAKHPLVFKSGKFSLALVILGAAFILSSMIGDKLSAAFNITALSSSSGTGLVFFRVGIVLLLNSFVSYLALKFDSIPKFIILVGRNTLVIYVVHLIILYGSAWNPGINKVYAKSFSGIEAIGAALIMISLMTLMVMFINFIKMKNKSLVA
jgi:uncharacterized membrane protein